MRIPCRFVLAPIAALLLASALPAQDTAELLKRMKIMEDRIHALEAEVQTLKAQPPAAVVPPAPAAPVETPLAQTTPPVEAPVTLGGAGGVGGQGAQSRHQRDRRFSRRCRQPGEPPHARARNARKRGRLPGGHRSLCPRRLLSHLRRTGRQSRRGLPHLHRAARRPPVQGRQDARGFRQGEHDAQPRAAVDRPPAGHPEPGGRRGRHQRRRALAQPHPARAQGHLPGRHGPGLPRRHRGCFRVATRRSDVSTVGHLRAYRDITESTNLDLGVSYARGHSPFGDGINQLYGVDATLRWKPLRRAIYHSFVARSEFIWARTDVSHRTSLAACSGIHCPPRSLAKPFGYYVSGDYQLGRRWFLGGRFDRSERGQCLPTNPEPYRLPGFDHPVQTSRATPLSQDTGGSVLLTYWPSEFSQIRGQLRRTRYGEGLTANELLFQFQFSMGAHGAHPFLKTVQYPKPIGTVPARRGSKSRRKAPTNMSRKYSPWADAAGRRAAPAPLPRLNVVTTTEDLAALAREVGGDRDQRRFHRQGLPGPALRRAQAQLPAQAPEGGPAGGGRPATRDRLAAAADHPEPELEDPGRALRLSGCLAVLPDPRDPDGPGHARHGRRPSAGQPALLARPGKRAPHRQGPRGQASARCSRPTPPTSRSATPISTSV